MPWQLREHGDYERSCQKCEVIIWVRTPGELKQLVQRLKNIKSGKGITGRMITADFTLNGTPLKSGDRLEPSRELMDTFSLERSACPVVLTFWRATFTSDSKIVDPMNHRCPLFSLDLGTSPTK
eukprot:8591314-Pyramimonas_sp.AAC.1